MRPARHASAVLHAGRAGAVLAVFAAPVCGQDLASQVAAVLAAHMLELDAAALTGPGAEWLLAAAANAEFLLIGESHGNRQTPALTAALAGALADRGYGGYAIETGPVSTRRLVELLETNGIGGAEEWLRRQPHTMAFMNWREEIAAVAAALEAGYRVWGIDQEFLGAGQFLLGRLGALAPDDAARDLAARELARANEGFTHYAASGDSDRSFLALATEADFDALAAAFREPEAAEIVAELRASARIYRHYRERRYYENNRDRIALMKRHMVAGLDALEREGGARSKVLVRLGSMHCGRGYSPLQQLDLGNHLAERAVARGGDSLHLYVFARRSKRGEQTRDYADDAPWLKALYDPIGDRPASVVFDLRPLRPVLCSPAARQQLPELHDLAFRYDAALIMPVFDAATELAPAPRR